MLYASVQDITNRYALDFLHTIVDESDEKSLNTTAIQKALLDASGLIDSYLSIRYTIPLVTYPDLLKRLCVDIALYWLSPDAGTATEEKRQRYEDALAWLERIAQGKTGLGIVDSRTPNKKLKGRSVSDGVLIQSNTRLFSRNTLGVF